MKDYYILGLHIGLHDSSAVLLKNDEVVAVAEQERFSRNKIAEREAPIDAILFCLKKAGITIHDIEAIALGTDWDYRDSLLDMTEEESRQWIKVNDVERYLPSEIFGDDLPPIIQIRHHLAHAASAYRASGFDDAAILVIDNRGENESSSLGYSKNGKIEFYKQLDISQSLGTFYSRACSFTGLYGQHREVGKFMGLASYGQPIIEMPIAPDRDGQIYKKIGDIMPLNNYKIPDKRTAQLKKFFEENCFPYEAGNKEEIMGYANFAASAQKALEDVILDFVQELKEKTGFDNIVISGGVALNCSSNGKIEKSGIFDNIYIPPFAGDAGTALGAALELNYMRHGVKGLRTPLKSAAWGAEYSKDEIKSILDANLDKIKYKEMDCKEMCDYLANEIYEGKVVGWCQGRFEIGPRALGQRSILANPTTRKSLIKLNQIKEREMWRPIAPSVLKEFYSEYFTGKNDNKQFMNIAVQVKEDKRKLIPAVVHIDGTARPQVVECENQKYYNLIEAFYERSGIPLLCNTSFNRRGEPLINNPQEAINSFIAREIDLLVFGDFLIEKR